MKICVRCAVHGTKAFSDGVEGIEVALVKAVQCCGVSATFKGYRIFGNQTKRGDCLVHWEETSARDGGVEREGPFIGGGKGRVAEGYYSGTVTVQTSLRPLFTEKKKFEVFISFVETIVSLNGWSFRIYKKNECAHSDFDSIKKENCDCWTYAYKKPGMKSFRRSWVAVGDPQQLEKKVIMRIVNLYGEFCVDDLDLLEFEGAHDKFEKALTLFMQANNRVCENFISWVNKEDAQFVGRCISQEYETSRGKIDSRKKLLLAMVDRLDDQAEKMKNVLIDFVGSHKQYCAT